jgi:hypothetical protein
MAILNAEEVYVALRHAERQDWSFNSGSDETSMLPCLKRAYDLGYEPAFWHALRFCEQTNTPKPPWVRDKFDRYIEDRVNGVPVKKKVGAPKKWRRDLEVFVWQKRWRSRTRDFGAQRKQRFLSERTALKLVRYQIIGLVFDDDHAEYGLPTLGQAWRKAQKRFAITDPIAALQR